MSDTTAAPRTNATKRSKTPLVIGVLALFLGGGGGFFATYSGMILMPKPMATDGLDTISATPMPDVSFVSMEPLAITLRPGSQSRHLLFRANLEVPSQYMSDVEIMLPRIIDLFNGYLRAVQPADFDNHAVLFRIRNHLLHRAKLVVGPERINSVLIMEFVLN